MVNSLKVPILALGFALVCAAIPSLKIAGAAGILLFIVSWLVGTWMLNRDWSLVPNSIKICHFGVTLILIGAVISAIDIIRTGQEEFGFGTVITFIGYSMGAYGLFKAAQARDATSGLGDVYDSLASAVLPLTLISIYVVPFILEDVAFIERLDTVMFYGVMVFMMPVMFLLIYGSGKRSTGATWAASAGMFAIAVTALSIQGDSVGASWQPELVRFYSVGFIMYALAVSHPSLQTFATPGIRKQTYRWKLYALVACGFFLSNSLIDFSTFQYVILGVGVAIFAVVTVARLRIATITNQRLTKINTIHSTLAESLAEADTIESSILAGERACQSLLGSDHKVLICHAEDLENLQLSIAHYKTSVKSEASSTTILVDKVVQSYQRVAIEQIATVVDFATASVESRAEKAEKIAEEGWRQFSLKDQVTNLPNQKDFEEHEIKASNILTVFYFDDIERVRESEGIQQAEDLMKLFATRCSEQTRSDDVLWRGAGFKLILLSQYSVSDPTDWIESKRQYLSEVVNIGSASLSPTVSAGTYVIEEDMSATSALLRAEMALNQVRESNKPNSSILFDKEIEKTISRRWKIESGFAAALKNPPAGGFRVEYQPIVDTISTEVSAVEALARWTHPDLGSISPAEFIPAAEKAGLVSAIDNFVLNTALQDLDTLRAAKPGIEVHVNMSPVGLTPERIREAANTVMLARGSSEENGMVFEVIESAIGTQPLDELSAAMRYARELGIGISIDDFGTGESNFDRLGKLPFTQVKLANQFVQSEDSLLIESMLRTVSHLRLESVVEGVETKEQYEMVKAAGGDKIQGWYFVKAAPLAKTIDYIIDRKVPSNNVSEIHINSL